MSFKDDTTANLFEGIHKRRFSVELERQALRKLLILDHVSSLEELKVPPNNRLEKLKGDREGQFSVRVNRQWRICFIWKDGDAFNVELVDYH